MDPLLSYITTYGINPLPSYITTDDTINPLLRSMIRKTKWTLPFIKLRRTALALSLIMLRQSAWTLFLVILRQAIWTLPLIILRHISPPFLQHTRWPTPSLTVAIL